MVSYSIYISDWPQTQNNFALIFQFLGLQALAAMTGYLKLPFQEQGRYLNDSFRPEV